MPAVNFAIPNCVVQVLAVEALLHWLVTAALEAGMVSHSFLVLTVNKLIQADR